MSSKIIRTTIPVDSTLIRNHRDSLRRHFVDFFCRKNTHIFEKGVQLLDLGGNKSSKRGGFNIEKHSFSVCCANYSLKYHPDLRADAIALPFKEQVFDGVICTELLEHVQQPNKVLEEVHRVLRPGAALLLTVPFMFPVHADPHDYGRYTDQFWVEVLEKQGVTDIVVEWQGGFWCVLGDMIRGYTAEKEEQLNGIRKKMVYWMNTHLQYPLKKNIDVGPAPPPRLILRRDAPRVLAYLVGKDNIFHTTSC